MSSARFFQSAARYASVLRPTLRAGASGSFDSFVRSSVRAAGVLSSSTWSAQAAPHRQRFPPSQPSYGFAAQGLMTTCDAGDASSCTATDGSSSSPSALASGEDSECLANGEDEGVIPRPPIQPTSGPPWLSPSTRLLHHHNNNAGAPPPHPASWAATGPSLAGSFTSCTGIRLPNPASRPALFTHSHSLRAYGSKASDSNPKEEGLSSSEPSFRHPSRPGHGVPAAHHRPPKQGDGSANGARLSGPEYRARHHIKVDDPSCPEPFQEFADAHFPPAITDVLSAMRYSAPSTIQAQAWPVALAGRDVVAIASTGSGKTLGFLLPALMHIQARGCDPAKGPTALILAPTRELARQIEVEANRFASVVLSGADGAGVPDQQQAGVGRKRHRADGEGRRGLRTACLYGGASRGDQYRLLQRRPHLVIATPGRLLDFVEEGAMDLRQVSYLVLDEADRMLDMGFEPQINNIARSLPGDRQTLFFSATWPKEVRDTASRFAKQRPVHIFIGDVQDKPVAATSIRQRAQIVESADKMKALEEYLREQLGGGGGQGPDGRPRCAMVFCKTKAGCEHLAWQINNRMPFQAAALHGDKSQAARDYALQSFRSGRVPVLVATDVAARGLDIPNVTAVVNFDMPEEIDSYVHRIGRTGRAGASGDSLAILTRSHDVGVAQGLITVLEGAGQEVPEELRDLAASGGRRGKRGQFQSHRWGGRGGQGGRGSGGYGRDRGWDSGRDIDRDDDGGHDRERRDRGDGRRGESKRRGWEDGGDEEEEDAWGERRPHHRHHADGWRSSEGGRPAYSRARG